MAVATSTHQEHSIPELKKQGIFSYFSAVITGDMVKGETQILRFIGLPVNN